jgi:hypothetical protein
VRAPDRVVVDARTRPGFRGERERFNWRSEPRWFRPERVPFSGPEFSQDRSQIAWIQSCLARLLGSWVAQDGHWGPNTSGAIRTFQEQKGLPQTGLYDQDTANALQAACAV